MRNERKQEGLWKSGAQFDGSRGWTMWKVVENISRRFPGCDAPPWAPALGGVSPG